MTPKVEGGFSYKVYPSSVITLEGGSPFDLSGFVEITDLARIVNAGEGLLLVVTVLILKFVSEQGPSLAHGLYHDFLKVKPLTFVITAVV